MASVQFKILLLRPAQHLAPEIITWTYLTVGMFFNSSPENMTFC